MTVEIVGSCRIREDVARDRKDRDIEDVVLRTQLDDAITRIQACILPRVALYPAEEDDAMVVDAVIPGPTTRGATNRRLALRSSLRANGQHERDRHYSPDRGFPMAEHLHRVYSNDGDPVEVTLDAEQQLASRLSFPRSWFSQAQVGLATWAT